MSEIVRPFNIMCKPVCGTCNLDCSYCYYTHKPKALYPGVTRFQMADDVLEIHAVSDGQVLGTAPERVRHFMEIRGLGIVSVLPITVKRPAGFPKGRFRPLRCPILRGDIQPR